MFMFHRVKKDVVYAPLEGRAIPMSQVEDETFSQEMLGKGIAIEPSLGKVVAPFNGKVETLFDTKHAIGLLSDNGIEVLIHIGIDTVELGGKYYTTHISEGDKVKRGDVLVEFDMEAIKKAGYMITTPVIVTNTSDYRDVVALNTGDIKLLDEVVRVIK
jgi:glucose-specific phosphotransferase system IIA component